MMQTSNAEQIATIDEKLEKKIETITETDLILYEEYKKKFEADYLNFYNSTVSKQHIIRDWQTFLSVREGANNRIRKMLS